jgi:recombination protein RecA
MNPPTPKKTKTSIELLSGSSRQTSTSLVNNGDVTKDSALRRSTITGLIKDINKTAGEKIAFNLLEDKDAPTNVNNWISSTSLKLDYIISNKRPGGLPEGRIIEMFGEPSSGKSTIAQTFCAQIQKNGGIAVYIDAENATSLENLKLLGVNVEELIFVQEQCVENIFQLIESIITSIRNQMNDVPILIVWDSIAASATKVELEATYEQNQIGIKARALSKGIMKVNNMLKDKRVTLLLLNQTRQKIGIIMGDATTTPGGMAIPFASSVRLRVYTPSKIKETIEKQEIVKGIEVKIGAVKNKVGRPYRQTSIQIIYGKGITDSELLFDDLRVFCESNKFKDNKAKYAVGDVVCVLSGAGAWKNAELQNLKTGEVVKDVKFYKADFETKVLNNPEFKEYVLAVCDGCFILDAAETDSITKAITPMTDHEID